MNYFSFLHRINTWNRTLFEVPTERQRAFLERLPEPQDDWQRSYLQYRCQMLFSPGWIVALQNLAAAVVYPFAALALLLRRRVTPCDTPSDAVLFTEGISHDLIPGELSGRRISDREGYALHGSDLRFCFSGIDRYFYAPYFHLKMLFKVAQYRRVIDRYRPQRIVAHAEFSFCSSAVTAYCHRQGIEHLNLMHGEKLFYIRDAFFRFDRCYVWDRWYIDLFRALRAEPTQFVVSLPAALRLQLPDLPATADYTYYLAAQSPDELRRIVRVMEELQRAGHRIRLRPHPRYTDLRLLRTLIDPAAIEACGQVSLEESLATTRHVVSGYSTVLQQAVRAGRSIVMDDVSDPMLYGQLVARRYLVTSLPHKRLSSIIRLRKRILFVTRLRGFFRALCGQQDLTAQFLCSPGQIYEVNSPLRRIAYRLAHSRLFDRLGVIQVIRCRRADADGYASYNRFLHADKPYLLYVENPTALYHYRLQRGRSRLGRRRIERCLADPHLRAILCMSHACRDTFEALCGPIPPHCRIETVYPLVPRNPHCDEEQIAKRCRRPTLRLLYIAQGERFYSKGGLEVVEAFQRLTPHYDLHLTVVTSLREIEPEELHRIGTTAGVTLQDFTLTPEEMQRLYAASSVLLQPTSDDSFGLTILEAMKAGLPVLTTRLYSIPEIIEEGVNGFLTTPHHAFFDSENRPNPAVWEHRRQTIYSQRMSPRIVDFLVEKIALMADDRELLTELSINSFRKANTPPLDEATIQAQWNEIIRHTLPDDARE